MAVLMRAVWEAAEGFVDAEVEWEQEDPPT